jgi:hypothetical protein
METQCIFSFKTGIFNHGFIYALAVDNMGVPIRPCSIRWIGLMVRGLAARRPTYEKGEKI